MTPSRTGAAPAAAPATPVRKARQLPPLVIASGSLEALKWLGLVLMVLDHVNKHLLEGDVPLFFALGRAAMPIFVVVLAYNLARPSASSRCVYQRVFRRLAIAGALASVPYMALGGLAWGWWPLNIMATLLVAAVTLYLLDHGGPARQVAAALVFGLGGLWVEFWWPALAIAVGAWSYCRRPSWLALLLLVAALAALQAVNGNAWAFLAVPLVLSASRVALPVPRVAWVFYAAYPLHLAALWLAKTA